MDGNATITIIPHAFLPSADKIQCFSAVPSDIYSRTRIYGFYGWS